MSSLTSRCFPITAILILLASAAAAQLTSETPLSEPQYRPASGSGIVASNGTDFLVASFRGTGIYANRVSRTGENLDGTGIRIPVSPELPTLDQHFVGLFAIDGAYTLIYSYTVTWGSTRTVAAIISGEGQLLQGPRVILDGPFVRVGASNGSRIVLLAGVELVVLNGRAEVLDRFPSLAVPSYSAGLASNGSTFLVVTYTSDNRSNNVNLIALDANGRTGRINRVNISASGADPIIASDGVDYLVVYQDARTGKTVAWSVSPTAEVHSASTLDIRPSYSSYGSLLWTGQQYLLGTTTSGPGQQTAVMTMDRSASTVGNARLFGPGTSPSLAWNGSEALMVWGSGSQSSRNGFELQGALLTEDGTPRSTVATISISSNIQVAPVIATGGAYDLAVWTEPGGIYATRITTQGVALDGRGIPIFTPAADQSLTLNGVQPMRVLFDGAAYLVAWGSYGGVMGQRIDPQTGLPLGTPIALASCATSFDMANDSSSAVLFAVDCSDRHLYAQRVGLTGAVGPKMPISPTGTLTVAPRAAWNGQEWLVVWNHLIPVVSQMQFPVYNSDVYAARLSGSLTLLDTQPIGLALSKQDEISPLVASDGRDFLVVWSRRSYDAVAGLYFRRVRSDGSIGATSSPFATGPYEADSLVWSGSRYTVAYESTWAYWNHDLFLSHIAGREDETSVPDQVPFSLTELDERSASLVATSAGRVRLVYMRVAPEPQYGGVPRVFLRDDIPAPRRRPARAR